MTELLSTTSRGLACEAGGFHIDPWRPSGTDRAIITHAHSDHARAGAGEYLTARSGVEVLRARIGQEAKITGIEFGERVVLGDTTVSLHPAGHVLGSAMVRVERLGEVWLVSGDYKVVPDCCGEVVEPVRCNTFITESTFGLPVFRWQARERIAEEINAWWRANAAEGTTSIVYAYALGKAQSVLAMLDRSIGPIFVHGAVERFLPIYARAGVDMPVCLLADKANVKAARGRGMIVAPPSADNSAWVRKFGNCAEAFASGWMQIRGKRRRRGVERGFVLSDHADWPGLLSVVEATGATRVGVTHGYTGVLSRWLRERGLEAWALRTEYAGELAGEHFGETDGAEGEEDAAK